VKTREVGRIQRCGLKSAVLHLPDTWGIRHAHCLAPRGFSDRERGQHGGGLHRFESGAGGDGPRQLWINGSTREISCPHPRLADHGASGTGSRVPDMMENTRRWSGFVCPDCRFVFRVPRDHDGQGVVCPSCRRVLKIPATGDQTPALVVPLPVTPGQAPDKQPKRRKRKSRRGQSHNWDSAHAGSRVSSRREHRQMLWILSGGAVCLGLAVAMVLLAMDASDSKTRPAEPDARQTAEPAQSPSVFSETAFLAEAETLARRFLEATSVEELLPLVRNPEATGARMREFYPDGGVEPAGMTAFNTRTEVEHLGGGYAVTVRTGSFEEKTMAFSTTSEGLRIDWESWVGWSEMPWERFLEIRPQEPKLFRVMLGPVDYYNFGFSDDRKWRSYRLLSPDDEHSLYAYVERDSVLDARIRPSPDRKQTPLTLSLRFPPDPVSPNQVLVDKWHADGWVLDNPNDP
jgi:hypothetical protein